jgi:hypothetical protein
MNKASCILWCCLLIVSLGTLSAAQQPGLTPNLLVGIPLPVVGQQVTAEAVVSDPTFSALPTGNVIFDFGDDSPTVDVDLANTLAVATHTYASLGSYKVTFTYRGDANFTSAERTMPLVTVLQRPVLHLHEFGDSITGKPTSTWPAQLDNLLGGWPSFNDGLSDGRSVDLAHWIYQAFMYPNYASTYLLGENDVQYLTTSAGQAQYQRTVLASVAFLAVLPGKSKVAANDPSVTRTGVWSASTVFPAIGLVSQQPASTLQANLTGNVLYLSLTSLKTTDYTVEILVDGVSKGTVSPVEDYDGNFWPGSPYGMRLVLGGDLTATHSVEIVCQTPGTSGCYVDWLGANGTSAPNLPPYVFMGTQYQVASHPAAAYQAMNGILRQIASDLAADGLPVWLADIATTFNGPLQPQCLLIDQVHPGPCANDVIEANFLAAMDLLTTEAQRIDLDNSGKPIVGVPFIVPSKSTSGLPVTLSVISGKATLNGNMLTATQPGPVTLEAQQQGNLTTLPAAPLQATWTVFTEVSLSPASIAFGTETVNTESNYQIVTLTNTGTSAAAISSIALTGPNASQFAFLSNCPENLAAGASCAIHPRFYPKVAGAASAFLTITDNAAGSPQSVILTGTAGTPAVSLSTTSLAFGSVPVNTESLYQGFTLSNTGGSPLTFTGVALTGTNKTQFLISGNTCLGSVAAGSNCTVHLHFYPTVTGAANAALTITDNATGSPQSVSLTGTGTAPGSGLTCFGDSIMAGYYISDGNPDNRFCSLVAAAMGWGTPVNYGKGGGMLGDEVKRYIAETPTYASQYVVLGFTNDNERYGSDPASLLELQSGVRHMLAWLAIPDANKQLVTRSGNNCTSTGTWNGGAGWMNTNTYAGVTVGASQTCTVQGTAVYVFGAKENGDPGTFNITIDGFNYGTYSVAGTILGTPINNWTSYPAAWRFTVPHGPHTVTMTVVTADGGIAFTGMAGNANGDDRTGPYVWIGGPPRATTVGYAIDCNTSSWASGAPGGCIGNPSDYSAGLQADIIRSVVSELASDGLGIKYVDVSRFDPNNTATGTAHLTFSGGGCTSEPQGYVGVSGGQLVAPVVIGNAGAGCTSAPIAQINGGSGGSGGAVTVVLSGSTVSTTGWTITPGSGYSGVTFDGLHPSDWVNLNLFTPAYVDAITTPPTTVSLSTTSLAFDKVAVNTESLYQGFTLTNTGGNRLTISSIALTGTNSAQFLISSNTCPANLAAGANCVIHLHFYPHMTGPAVAALTICDSATGSSQSVALTGTGLAPEVSLSATSVAFSTELVNTESAYQPVTLTNTGDSPLTISGIALTGPNKTQFLVSSNYCPTSLAAGANCVIHLHFYPQVTGAASAALTITDNATGSPQSVTLTGTGTLPPPVVSLSTTSLAFGNVPVDTESSYQGFTLTNTGGSPLTISSVALTGTNKAQFLISGNTCPASLAPGANCAIHLHFYPQVTGAVVAALTITDNASGSPQSVALTGTGTTPAATFTINPPPPTITSTNRGQLEWHTAFTTR